MRNSSGKGIGILFMLMAVLLVAAPSSALAEAQGSAKAPAHIVLPNGLEVFVVENHAVPLATICVAFRCGAIAHDPDTAGLFHLYEHMLFDGNEKYPNQAAFTAALNKMGVANWNGGTGNESVNYYITVPSDKTGEGVEFWSWAVKRPVFNAEKLENEKNVVINEIQGYHGDPNQIFENALDSRFYAAYPWRKNIDGPEANISKATVAQLEKIRSSYYIPKNTALLVGGDVSAAQVFDMAKRYFGDWTGGEPAASASEPFGPSPAGIKLVYPDESFYKGIAQLQIRWRGPDSMRQTKDTYTSDVFLYLLSSPVGKFKQNLMEKCPGLYDPEYISFSYPTSRDGGIYYFSTYLLVGDPAMGPTLDRVAQIEKAVKDEFALIAADPEAYFGAEELSKAKAKLIDQNLLSTEVASSYVTDTLTFWWSCATADYFFGYEANCSKVGFADIKALIGTYLADSNDAIALRMRSDNYAAEAGMADKLKALGYTEVSADNAFWWQLKGAQK
jgi:zinc protease